MPIVTVAEMIERAKSRISAMRIAPPSSPVSSQAAAREFEMAIEAMEYAWECWSIVETLRAPEGSEITLVCDNPDFDGTSIGSIVELSADFTEWESKRFAGANIIDALRAAKAARDAHVAVEKKVK